MPRATAAERAARTRGGEPLPPSAVRLSTQELVERVDAVLALHFRQAGASGLLDRCVGCGQSYPCSTVRVLRGES
jgi:hypothetical protein